MAVYLGFFTSIYVSCGHLVLVGMMGGGAYVACFYFILNSHRIEPDIKELSVNIGTIFNDMGIILASCTVLFFDNTIMK